MSLIEVAEESFGKTIGEAGIALVDCWADWCATCMTFAPVFEETAGRHPSVTFGKLDAVSERSLISTLGVEHIPTLLVYRDGFLLLRRPGTFDADQLDDIIRQAESINMEEVRVYVEETAGRTRP